jgi:pyridoxal phosphate enzyme (YggS family)
VLDSAALRARLDGVRDRIARAAGRAGRDPASIRLIAVSKTFPPEYVLAAADAGQADFGENKVQEGLQKIELTARVPLRWHLIGHLQSNKARKATSFHTIHTIDDANLLRKVDEAAAALGRRLDIMIQVDLAQEPTKHGSMPDAVPELIAAATGCRAARLIGLMTLPPAASDPAQARPYFARLRQLRDELVAQGAEPSALADLSMGMSHDFEVAIEEGATMVRVGSAIFGRRGYV